jgi:hypothetical protein
MRQFKNEVQRLEGHNQFKNNMNLSVNLIKKLCFLLIGLLTASMLNDSANASNTSSRFLSNMISQLPQDFTVVILRKGFSSPNSFPVGSGVIISRTQDSISSKYKYTVITNQHVINPSKSINKDSVYYISIGGRSHSVFCVSKVFFPDIDVAVLEFSSFQNYSKVNVDSQGITGNEPVYISGWDISDTNPKFKTVEGSVQNSNNFLRYTNNPGTVGGMSGGPILNSMGNLVGIHKGILVGIPMAQVSKVISNHRGQKSDGDRCACFGFVGNSCSFYP